MVHIISWPGSCEPQGNQKRSQMLSTKVKSENSNKCLLRRNGQKIALLLPEKLIPFRSNMKVIDPALKLRKRTEIQQSWHRLGNPHNDSSSFGGSSIPPSPKLKLIDHATRVPLSMPRSLEYALFQLFPQANLMQPPHLWCRRHKSRADSYDCIPQKMHSLSNFHGCYWSIFIWWY